MAFHSKRKKRRGLWSEGEPFVWLTAGALALTLVCVAALLLVVLTNGLGVLWPATISRIELTDGQIVIGTIMRTEAESPRAPARIQVKVGNRELYDLDFRWIERNDIQSISTPSDLVALERDEWGNFYGYLDSMPDTPSPVPWEALTEKLDALGKQEVALEYYHDQISALNNEMLALKDQLNRLQHEDANLERQAEIEHQLSAMETEFQQVLDGLVTAEAKLEQHTVTMKEAGGMEKVITLAHVVRAYRPNAMGLGDKTLFYLIKLRELLFDDPRESNTEGGLFPAIFGTIILIFLMSILSFPLGVVAGVYLRLYAKDGPMLYIVRIAVNNLAGIPSIVYGIFGLGFFVYGLGGTIDTMFFAHRLPTPTFGTGGILWASLTLGLLTVPVVIVATEEALGAIPRTMREGSYALGATRFQTLIRVLLPMAAPGIMTGFILAMARAAGEVAPLMITGVVKLAPALPVDASFPFVHLDRKFMHLGFHIYDIGFQSPNVEAAKPMVFVTTLLLIAIVLALSSIAIHLRNRLRKRNSVTHL